LKILIAEDEKISRIVLEASLKKRGHDVIAVENGLKAWEAFQQDYFPVMISDWMMPEMDGLALCRKIREQPHDNYTYLVLLTSLEGKTNYLEAMEAGADDFMTKAFDFVPGPISVNTGKEAEAPSANFKTAGVSFTIKSRKTPSR
jgi:two-component system, cell cycle response regulator